MDYVLLFPFIANKTGKTGISVSVTVRNLDAGTVVVNAQPATEVGDGVYKYVWQNNNPINALATATTADTTVDQQVVHSFISKEQMGIYGELRFSSVQMSSLLGSIVPDAVNASTSVTAIKGKTDNLPSSPAASGEYTTALTAIQADLDNPAQYKADVSGLALETTAQAIKTKTDQLTYTEGKVNANATIDASGLATEATLNAVKAKTDQLTFVNGKVDANATATVDTSGLATEATQQSILSMLSSDPLPVRIDGIVGSTITATRGNDWFIAIEGLTLDGKIQLAIKRNDNQPDDRSALFVDSATGLITLNGKPATDPTLASLTYAGGILTLSVDASVTAQLSAVSYRYGIQSVGGTVSEKYGGEFVVNADIVRATE